MRKDGRKETDGEFDGVSWLWPSNQRSRFARRWRIASDYEKLAEPVEKRPAKVRQFMSLGVPTYDA